MGTPHSSTGARARAARRLMIATRTGNGRLSDKQSVSDALIARWVLYNVTKNQILLLSFYYYYNVYNAGVVLVDFFSFQTPAKKKVLN